MQNIRRSNMQATQTVVPLEAIRQVVQEMQNPIKVEKPVEGDGGAYRAYNYKLFKK